MQPTNVLFLVENNPYPADFRVRREAETLRDAGYRVSVIAPRGLNERFSEDVNGVVVYRFPAPPSGKGVLSFAGEFAYATLAILAFTVWIWLRRGVDIVHAGNPPDTLVIVGALCRLFGKRFVFDQHDLAPETYLSRFAQPRRDFIFRLLVLFERLSYSTAHLIVTTNQSYRQVALSRGGQRREKVVVVRNGPPLSYRRVETDTQLTARARYLIGYVGTIGPQDGVDYWLRAVHELVYALGRRDFLAVVIGDGDALLSVQALARELQIEPFVWFTGRLSEADVRRHLSAVHVCVQPDPLSPLNDKSTMNKLMEYMALEKPTVAFDLCETSYSAQGAAVYVAPNDVKAFARQTSELLDDDQRRDVLGQIGRHRIDTELAWEYSAATLLRAYSTLRASLTRGR